MRPPHLEIPDFISTDVFYYIFSPIYSSAIDHIMSDIELCRNNVNTTSHPHGYNVTDVVSVLIQRCQLVNGLE